MIVKVRVHFKHFSIDQFVDVNTGVEQLKKVFPLAVKFEIDKSFSTLSHGRK